jgi:polyisoprenoid-binding protein YceI
MKKLLLIVLSLFLLGPGHLMAHEWELDSVHSGITFEIKHIYSTVSGRFTDFRGDVFFDPKRLDNSRFNFTVKVDSIDTHNGKRDNHLRSADFFNASKYSVMRFKSSRVSHAGGNKYILEGKMTVKDITKAVTVEFIYWGQKANPFKKNQMVAGFETRMKINRLDYHVGGGKFYKMGVVGKDVDILISLEMIRKK